MIRLERVDGAWEAVVWSEAPSIYFDTWTLDLFSTDQPLRTQFSRSSETRHAGDVASSVSVRSAHMAPTLTDLRSFLEDVGARWIPVTNDPSR